MKSKRTLTKAERSGRNGKSAHPILTAEQYNELRSRFIGQREKTVDGEFQQWLEKMPTLPDDPNVCLSMEIPIALSPRDWLILGRLAKKQMEPIGFVVEELLKDYCCARDNGEKQLRLR